MTWWEALLLSMGGPLAWGLVVLVRLFMEQRHQERMFLAGARGKALPKVTPPEFPALPKREGGDS